ncbi:zinc-binding dehydrogenase [Enterococcus raffinosus]|uniref:Zinc-binding dehydrogenase n=1 Tax=Enterococcus raffinosus TaxID=71452 RepID=A0AAW8T8Y8_9ENTE|nr:zinc-binding dehydrogenase [Enterococcus raffinosus]MDT2524718.1 zinc-binding dehydrogenase [Enterococcus raffinosus]MDT2528520.1 zinc-binding dehydrogenase [Enterococcus raffinosus]MDT2535435.1 zinc-binding dehydrogenase [Enterococcus raffinosus]MDT2545738.1 zinc-binding dehydrogenase [Enterococcus raffinosus]MDT2553567.1 zinc-binding dehydrogenase [Enterococcus raffinosus]
MKALYFEKFGGSEVLQYGELPRPVIGDYEVLVEVDYIGLNFADIYRRRGAYYIEKHEPYINGYEGAGVVVEVGSKVTKQKSGETVLFVDVPLANAEYVAVPSEQAIHLPAGIDSKLAASIGLQGMTADFLAHDLGKNTPGEKVFITGISGGVGQILSQMLVADGIEVYGSASSAEKQALALSHGVKQVYPSRENSWIETIEGQFATAYDGVGSTIQQSLDLIEHRGKVVFFGMAGGDPIKINPVDLMSESKSILTGDLWDYLTSYEERKVRSERLFSYFTKGQISISEPTIFPLSEGKQAHEFLETGNSIGKVLLKP